MVCHLHRSQRFLGNEAVTAVAKGEVILSFWQNREFNVLNLREMLSPDSNKDTFLRRVFNPKGNLL